MLPINIIQMMNENLYDNERLKIRIAESQDFFLISTGYKIKNLFHWFIL